MKYDDAIIKSRFKTTYILDFFMYKGQLTACIHLLKGIFPDQYEGG